MTYRRNHLVAVIAVILSIAGALWLAATAQPAHASTTPAAVTWADCPNLTGWSANVDEKERQPVATSDGVQFSGTQLMHHDTDVSLDDLKPGAYTVAGDAKPDQPSFFSVEVGDSVTNGYATLRWNVSTNVWDAVIKGQLVSHADPADFLGAETKWGTLTPEHTRVFTFGIGYTENPPGAVTTVISDVIFGGKHYPLTCKPQPSSSAPSSPSTSATPSHSASNPQHASTTPNPSYSTPGGALAITGPSTWLLGAAAVGVLAFGGVLLLASRRRRTKWRA